MAFEQGNPFFYRLLTPHPPSPSPVVTLSRALESLPLWKIETKDSTFVQVEGGGRGGLGMNFMDLISRIRLVEIWGWGRKGERRDERRKENRFPPRYVFVIDRVVRVYSAIHGSRLLLPCAREKFLLSKYRVHILSLSLSLSWSSTALHTAFEKLARVASSALSFTFAFDARESLSCSSWKKCNAYIRNADAVDRLH